MDTLGCGRRLNLQLCSGSRDVQSEKSDVSGVVDVFLVRRINHALAQGRFLLAWSCLTAISSREQFTILYASAEW